MQKLTIPIVTIIILVSLQLLVVDAHSLDVSVESDKESYRLGDQALIYGLVTENGNPVPNALVSVTIKDPCKNVVLSESVETNCEGKFEVMFEVKSTWLLGRYLVDVVVYAGNETVASTTYFYVREPSIITVMTSKNTTLGDIIKIWGDISPDPGKVRVIIHILGPANETLTTFTNEYGEFLVNYTPPRAGNYSAYAEWSGTSTLEGSISNITSFLVLRKPSKVILSLSRRVVKYGESIEIYGYIEPREAGAHQEVVFIYKLKGEREEHIISRVMTDAKGFFNLTWQPPKTGEYILVTLWNGTEVYRGANATITLTVERAPSKIKFTLQPSTIELGRKVTINGTLCPSIKNTYVIIEVKLNKTWVEVTRTSTENNGTFTYSWTPQHAGVYEVRVTWLGNENFEGCISKVLLLSVKKAKTSIDLKVSRNVVMLGEELTILGLVKSLVTGRGISDVIVKLKLTSPKGDISKLIIETNKSGFFLKSIKLDFVGNWSLIACWDGNYDYENSTSNEVIVEVRGVIIKKTLVYYKEKSFDKKAREVLLELQLSTNMTLDNLFISCGMVNMTLKNARGKNGYIILSVPKSCLESLGISIEDVKVVTSDNIGVFEIEEYPRAYLMKICPTSHYSELLVKIGYKLRLILIDLKGRPLANAIVSLYNDKILINTTLTDSKGICCFSAIPKANYTVVVYWKGYKVYKGSINVTDDVVQHVIVKVYDLKVFVKGFLGLPIKGVRVSIVSSNGLHLSSVTNEEGVALLKQLPKGIYKVTAHSLTHVTKQVTLDGNIELFINLITPLDVAVVLITFLTVLSLLISSKRRYIRI